MYKKLVPVLLLCTVMLCGCNEAAAPFVQETQEAAPVSVPTQTPEAVQKETPVPTQTPYGNIQPIPEKIREKMRGISMPQGATVSFDDLMYLTLPYYDFDYNIKEGHMVIAKELAQDTVEIFEELYKIKYPIESIELIDYFNDKQTKELDSLDRASMGNNNTSAFCYRTVSGMGNLSKHALGRAIDINPKINPYVTGSTVSPRNAVKYADRSAKGLSEVEKRAMIHKDDEAYRIFAKHGFEWGGEIWSGIYDYQHFQRP